MQIYDTDLIPLLLSTVTDLFEKYRIKEFIISATLRNQDTFQAFLAACGEFIPVSWWTCLTRQNQTALLRNVYHSNLQAPSRRLGSSIRRISQSGRIESVVVSFLTLSPLKSPGYDYENLKPIDGFNRTRLLIPMIVTKWD